MNNLFNLELNIKILIKPFFPNKSPNYEQNGIFPNKSDNFGLNGILFHYQSRDYVFLNNYCRILNDCPKMHTF